MTAGGDPLLYLSRAQVESLGLTGLEVVDLLAAAFAEKGRGRVELPPKIGVHPRQDAFLHAMPAYLADSDVVGLKWVSGFPTNVEHDLPYLHGLALLNDAATGRPLAVLDATWITEVRTAAASVLGIRRYATAPSSVAIVGCGRQGSAHAQLLLDAYPGLSAVRCYDPVGERATALAAAIGPRGVAVPTVLEAVRDADVLVTSAPVVFDPEHSVRAGDPAPHAVVCAVDFDASVHPDVVAEAVEFVVDDLAQYLRYQGFGHFTGYPATPREFADVVAEPAADAAGIVVLAPLGIAMEDVAVAAELVRRANAAGIGTPLDF